MKATVYNIKGEKVKELDLPSAVFEVPADQELIHQVVVAYEANKRQNLAHTKTKGEVSGGGKKPWKQKGTGRARHGSIRSPLWVGGGITFGPRSNRNFAKKINKKVARKALTMVLSDRAEHGAISLVEEFAGNAEKTKTYAAFIKAIGADKKRRVLFVTNEVNSDVVRCTKNIPGINVKVASDINTYDIIRGTALVMEESAIDSLVKRLA